MNVVRADLIARLHHLVENGVRIVTVVVAKPLPKIAIGRTRSLECRQIVRVTAFHQVTFCRPAVPFIEGVEDAARGAAICVIACGLRMKVEVLAQLFDLLRALAGRLRFGPNAFNVLPR